MRSNQKVSRLIISFVNWFVYESIRAILGKLFILEKRIDIYIRLNLTQSAARRD